MGLNKGCDSHIFLRRPNLKATEKGPLFKIQREGGGIEHGFMAQSSNEQLCPWKPAVGHAVEFAQ